MARVLSDFTACMHENDIVYIHQPAGIAGGYTYKHVSFEACFTDSH